VQSNKTRLVAQHFDWVHTIDRLKIAERLNEQRPADAARLQVCIQVNIDNSPSKSGISPDEVLALAQLIAKLPRLQLRGIMAIPDIPANISDDVTINNIAAQAIFTPAKAIFDHLNALNFQLDTLSIGMSADLEPAIAAGSTMVRVGSAIFGSRA
jgi:pyridoxal phosphate enzyme (YggS family)